MAVDIPENPPPSHQPGPALRFVVAALIVRDGQLLIGQRRPDQVMALKWEFPGGKIEAGEIQNQIFNEVRWVKLADLPEYDFLAADLGLIRDLAEGKLL